MSPSKRIANKNKHRKKEHLLNEYITNLNASKLELFFESTGWTEAKNDWNCTTQKVVELISVNFRPGVYEVILVFDGHRDCRRVFDTKPTAAAVIVALKEYYKIKD